MVESHLDRLGLLVARLMRAMHRLTRTGDDELDLTPHQCLLLSTLETKGPMSIGELRQAAHGAQSTMSEMVGRLARAGYVHKKPAPEDRRAVKVAISAHGRAVLVQRQREMRAKHEALLSALSPEDQERFLTAFETIVSLADRAAGNVSGGEDDNA